MTGLAAACAVLIGTVVIVIILSTIGSDLEEHQKTYESEIQVLKVHNCFLVSYLILVISN